MRGKKRENPWLLAKIYDIPTSWHTWLESCWFPANFGTWVEGGWGIYLTARIFSTPRVMVVTQILESLLNCLITLCVAHFLCSIMKFLISIKVFCTNIFIHFRVRKIGANSPHLSSDIHLMDSSTLGDILTHTLQKPICTLFSF